MLLVTLTTALFCNSEPIHRFSLQKLQKIFLAINSEESMTSNRKTLQDTRTELWLHMWRQTKGTSGMLTNAFLYFGHHQVYCSPSSPKYSLLFTHPLGSWVWQMSWHSAWYAKFFLILFFYIILCGTLTFQSVQSRADLPWTALNLWGHLWAESWSN